MTDNISESEQVEVSASKLQLLLASHHEFKEKHLKEVAQLNAKLKAKEQEIKLYNDAIQKLGTMKKQKNVRTGDNTRRVIDEINKSKEFDKWYDDNKNRLIEEEYEKNYKSEVDKIQEKLSVLLN